MGHICEVKAEFPNSRRPVKGPPDQYTILIIQQLNLSRIDTARRADDIAHHHHLDLVTHRPWNEPSYVDPSIYLSPSMPPARSNRFSSAAAKELG